MVLNIFISISIAYFDCGTSLDLSLENIIYYWIWESAIELALTFYIDNDRLFKYEPVKGDIVYISFK